MKAQRTEYLQIYKATHNERTFWIDGYTGEWMLKEGTDPHNAEWWETFPTKRDALAAIETLAPMGA